MAERAGMGLIPEKLVKSALAIFQIRIAPEASQLQVLVLPAPRQGRAVVLVKGINIGKNGNLYTNMGMGQPASIVKMEVRQAVSVMVEVCHLCNPTLAALSIK
jgi:hypothetical protein